MTIQEKLDRLSDLWITAELTEDPTDLFEALWPIAPRYFAKHCTPAVMKSLRDQSWSLEEYPDYLQIYWMTLARHWMQIVPHPYLIHHSLHYYARSVTSHALRKVRSPTTKWKRDWFAFTDQTLPTTQTGRKRPVYPPQP